MEYVQLGLLLASYFIYW